LLGINLVNRFFKKKKPNKNQHHMKNPNSLSSGTNDSDMLLILKLSILGSLELLEDEQNDEFEYEGEMDGEGFVEQVRNTQNGRSTTYTMDEDILISITLRKIAMYAGVGVMFSSIDLP
jgi:hypothetical protein